MGEGDPSFFRDVGELDHGHGDGLGGGGSGSAELGEMHRFFFTSSFHDEHHRSSDESHDDQGQDRVLQTQPLKHKEDGNHQHDPGKSGRMVFRSRGQFGVACCRQDCQTCRDRSYGRRMHPTIGATDRRRSASRGRLLEGSRALRRLHQRPGISVGLGSGPLTNSASFVGAVKLSRG